MRPSIKIDDDKVYKVEGTNFCINVCDGVIYSRPNGFAMFAHFDTDDVFYNGCLDYNLIERTEEQEERYNRVWGWD